MEIFWLTIPLELVRISLPSMSVKVVIDAMNVGCCFTNHQEFCIQGVVAAITYLESRGVQVTTFLPARMFRVKGASYMMTAEQETITKLRESNVLSEVPAGNHDDPYILKFAKDTNAYILSNDLFNDHKNKLQETQENSGRYAEFRDFIKDYRVGYTFVGNQKVFMIDPESSLSELIATGTTDTASAATTVGHQIAAYNPFSQMNEPVQVLSELISYYGNNNQTMELKYALLTRVVSYGTTGRVHEAIQDLEYILNIIDPQCIDAIRMRDELCVQLQMNQQYFPNP